MQPASLAQWHPQPLAAVHQAAINVARRTRMIHSLEGVVCQLVVVPVFAS
jgi:hypothetical protein